MSTILAIMLRKDPKYQLLIKCRDIVVRTPEKAFRLSDLLTLDSFSWPEKCSLKKMFGGEYSEICSPGLGFVSENGIWRLDGDSREWKHVEALKILNHLHGQGKYTIGSLVDPGCVALIQALVAESNRLGEKESGEPGYKITEAMLTFIAAALTLRYDGEHALDYEFIKAFLECLSEYDEVLVEQFFENEERESGRND